MSFLDRFRGGYSEGTKDRVKSERGPENSEYTAEVQKLKEMEFVTHTGGDSDLTRRLRRGQFVVHEGTIYAKPETTQIELTLAASIGGAEDFGESKLDGLKSLGFSERPEADFSWE